MGQSGGGWLRVWTEGGVVQRPPLPPVWVLLSGLFGAALVWLVGVVQARSVDRSPGWLALGVFVGCLVVARWRA